MPCYDLDILKALSRFDQALIDKIGPQRFDNFLQQTIKARPKCKTCGNSGDALVGDLDKILDDLHDVATTKAVKPDGSFVDGFEEFLDEAGQGALKAKGAALTLRKLSDEFDSITAGGWKLDRFEGGIPDIETGHLLDVHLTRTVDGDTFTKSLEMKNWSAARSMNSGSTYQQFKAYITSKNDFEYHFSSEEVATAMRKKFEDVFKDAGRANELFIENPDLFKGLAPNIESADDLVELASNGELAALINWIK